MPLPIRSTTLAALLLCGAAPALAQDKTPVSGGELVAVLAGCAACHDSPDGTDFGGGLVLKTPFGDLAAPNITQDAATGIGDYTFDDFRRVIHEGIRKDGAPLYPAMPYTHYTKMADDDVKVLWDYVRTVPAVHHEVDVNRLPFPFGVRQNMWVWRQLYFTDGRFQPSPNHDAVWNRGAYIVEALAHCGACHTPRDVMGGPVQGRPLAGAAIEEWYAPDISDGPGSVIADWSQERLESFLRGESKENHVAVGSMHSVVEELAKVPTDDVRAIAVYLKNPIVTEEAPAPEPQPSAPPEVIALGKQTFETRCVSCHGADGKGAPGVAASLVDAGGVVALMPYNVISVLLEGIEPRGDFRAMPTFRDTLGDEEIAAVANYVRSAWGNGAPTNALPEMVAGLRNVTTADPKAVAASSCAPAQYDRVGEALVAQITAVAEAPMLDTAKIDDLVAAYRKDRPQATAAETLVDLAGIYCTKLVEVSADPTRVRQHEFAFMQAVLRAPTR